MANNQRWFLVKLNWYEWIKEMSDEDVGKFFKALYSSSEPEGMLGLFFKSHYDEFCRVNEKREEGLAKKAEAGKKGMQKRWGNKDITNNNNDITEHNTVIKKVNLVKEKDNKPITEDNLQRQGQIQAHTQIQKQVNKANKELDEEFDRLFNL